MIDERRQLGDSVAIWGDTALVGAPGEDGSAGVAILFSRNSDGIWKEQQRLTASERDTDDNFGSAVAIRRDVALIGAPGAASAFAFVRRGGIWEESARLVADEPRSRTTFGTSVALHDCLAAVSSTTAFNGIADDDQSPGFAYVYDTCAAATWQRVGRVEGAQQARNQPYGRAIALSPQRLIVGAPSTDIDSVVYSYVRTASGFELEQEILSPELSRARFGQAVQIRDNVLVVGAPLQDSDRVESRSGAVYVLIHANGGWGVQRKLQPLAGQQPALSPIVPDFEPWMGYGHALAFDEDRLIVGAPSSGFEGDTLPGYTYVYERFGQDFVHRATIIGHDGEVGAGASVAVSENDLIVSEPAAFGVVDENQDGGPMGNVWAYDATRLGELPEERAIVRR